MKAEDAQPVPEQPAVEGKVPPKYCRTCGSAWQPEWTQCPICAAEAAGDHDATLNEPVRRPIASALVLYFAILVTAVFLGALLGVPNGILVGDILVSLLVLIWCWAGRKDLRPLLQSKSRPSWWIAAAGLAVVSFTLAAVSIRIIAAVLEVPVLHLPQKLLDTGYGWGTMLLVICFQPAVVEELAFRGIIYTGLLRILREPETVVATALMFTVIHLSLISFPHYFVMGLLLGWLRMRTGSLYPCMVLHGLHNLLYAVTELYWT